MVNPRGLLIRGLVWPPYPQSPSHHFFWCQEATLEELLEELIVWLRGLDWRGIWQATIPIVMAALILKACGVA